MAASFWLVVIVRIYSCGTEYRICVDFYVCRNRTTNSRVCVAKIPCGGRTMWNASRGWPLCRCKGVSIASFVCCPLPWVDHFYCNETAHYIECSALWQQWWQGKSLRVESIPWGFRESTSMKGHGRQTCKAKIIKKVGKTLPLIH